ncbi:GNAT family N-acetyltransferase [Aquabacterium sp.]|uniref:GNAT family N-acetyltransferase n=1 Tax=Aquabacterium sp. TaxID=1872578 RepID=UPI0037845B68
MKRSLRSGLRKLLHQAARGALGLLPREWRFALFRRMVDCDPAPGPELSLKIADTAEELEACFRLLHDAYVASGFMKPDPSGLRVTIYHALPTTTTLCAKVDGRVVGTMSLIREGVFGFPLQSAFDLSAVRAKEGQIAEISALAVHPDFRKTGGRILFPLMKFMYEYCTEYFDTRHLVIAVNPNKIELYESLLFFQRLQANTVDHYDFANGAPAVGATLDLAHAREQFKQVYGSRSERKNLHRYFVETRLPNIQAPTRRYHTTNDPVMTGGLIDLFFNRKTQVFQTLDERKKLLLRSIYDLDAYAPALPRVSETSKVREALRRHQRYSINCPAQLIVESYGDELTFELKVVELSLSGCQAECRMPLPEGTRGRLRVELGTGLRSAVEAVAVRRAASQAGIFYGFRVLEPDAAWAACVQALQQGQTHADLGAAASGGPSPALTKSLLAPAA